MRLVLPEPLAPGTVVAEARDVAVRLGGTGILHGVSLTVRTGEVLALLGPNGAGKSTLLAALTGDVAPSGGQALVHGRPVGAYRPRELALLRAVLPQHVQLSFPFTVAEVVEMGRAPWTGTARAAEDEEAVAAAMRESEVEEFADRRFPSLSGGERARVALARVLAQRVGLLLLDEPTAALDLRHQEAVLRVARRRAEAGDAVVVVLHDLGLAAAYAHRVALLAGGSLAACGTPAEVLTPALLSEVYRHEVEVLAHPRTGAPLVLPRRDPE
ncbi:iron complex transport system ATP-binding protein [Crossiella equi]|uniref:Iron complex transport system ATP-binding protein n=1 Tax=Crossiella equi TaxID=130796 RepID=A0ABS5AEI0_9PSEU|nr:heme ABC transporter ATP-binding protein [Crossiella equi]MBP2474998.1 iron complex transport system ATP-binding protein [Crossiella equi]